MKKNSILTSLFLLLLAVSAFGQPTRLESIEMVNMAGFYRMMIQCDSRVPFVQRPDSDGLGLTIYLREASLALPKKTYTFNNGGVATAHLTQLRQFPHVLKIEISFMKVLEFEVHATGGTINIDFRSPTTIVESKSQREGSSIFDHSIPLPGIKHI